MRALHQGHGMTAALVCLASGSGRTIANFLDKIEEGSLDARVARVICDRECSAIERLSARGVAAEVVPWTRGTPPEEYAGRVWPLIEEAAPDLVCLCGFLRLLAIPGAWRNRVMNIHPGRLPAFGGKGMYGERVHAAVLEAGAALSGCTVHFADPQYDKGPIILQSSVPVLEGDTPGTLAARVFEQECVIYPQAVSLFAAGRLRVEGKQVEIVDPQ
ncbi:MAG: phosphoribosylglycinamide formyltransferase [Planctomycetota bacterium]